MPSETPVEFIMRNEPKAVREGTGSALTVPKDTLPRLCRLLKESPFDFDDLNCLTAVDRGDGLELVYVLVSTARVLEVTLKTRLELSSLSTESVSAVWKSADWFEREVYDLFGVRFSGHPDLRRILNPEDWTGHPLRKNNEPPGPIAEDDARR